MSDIITELTDGVLRVELNRPERKNAMTGPMYARLAEILDEADKNEAVRVVLWHGAGDAFTAGNDIADFQKNPPQSGDSPQARLTEALSCLASRSSPPSTASRSVAAPRC